MRASIEGNQDAHDLYGVSPSPGSRVRPSAGKLKLACAYIHKGGGSCQWEGACHVREGAMLRCCWYASIKLYDAV